MPRLAAAARAVRPRSQNRAGNGLAGYQEWSLADLAQAEFQVFITGDRNLSFQQNLLDFSIAVIVLRAESIRLIHTRPLMPKVMAMLPSLKPGQLVTITA